jgi:hypothetical protein
MRPHAIFVALLLLPASHLSAAVHCADISQKLFGFSIGPVGSYPDSLRPGIVREGTAEVIKDVGFESLEGSSAGLRFNRVMAFFDRGQFIGFTAVAEPTARKGSLIADVARVLEAEIGGVLHESEDGTWAADCVEGEELLMSSTVWEGKERVKLHFNRPAAMAHMREYIGVYCADRKRRRPQDACK